MAFRVVAVGEILWDLLPSGKQLGGAPANFALHALGLGADARLVSRVGDDELGRAALEQLRQRGLPTDTVAVDPGAPTGTVSVALGPGGQPTYVIHEGVAWDRIAADEPALAAAGSADAVGFGSLAQRTAPARRAIRALIGAVRPGALRILDINLRPPFDDREVVEGSLAVADVLKLNDQELPRLASWSGLGGGVREQVEGLARRYGLGMVALTRGPDGSLLFADGQWSDHPGLPAAVADTVGAGDAFTAALALGLLAGWPLDEVNRRANAVAAFVCSQPGGTPALPDSLRAPFAASPRGGGQSTADNPRRGGRGAP